jgi:serine/threonine protein kinase/Flp pilus assembly protein TadD
MALPINTRLGPYEVLALLGSGGMGEVYRARDTRLERNVAIKVLPERFANDPVALARFQREAKAVAALSHPNIVALYDLGNEQGRTFVVMELLEGQTLGNRLKQAHLDWRSAVEIGTAIADGLTAAHARGIIHRDIKPENIFLTAGGGVKVLDFGLVRLESPVASGAPLGATVALETQPGVMMGTVTYMSPEQVRGQPADARSDVFSFGCVLYETLTGRRAFDGETSADVMSAILHGTPPVLSESGRERPAGLDRIIARCLEKEAARRFPSGRELHAALKDLGREIALADSRTQQSLETVANRQATPATARHSGPSIAVLPFVNMSSDKENEYFSDGLAEDLINALTKIEGLHVASRTSAFAFKGKNEDVRKIGEQLNVRTVLEGSVRKAGNRLRIRAQLANVADGYELWSETYNCQLEDVFDVQDEITQNITKALRVILTEKDKRALEKAATVDVQAYDYYLRGRQFFHQCRRKTLEFAQEMFQRAIEIDPGYARAYAGLADCYSLLCVNWGAGPDSLQRAETASRKALELAPDLAEAHAAHGLALSLNKQYDSACQELETAIRLGPTLFEAHYFYGRACIAQGKLAEAARLFEQASRLRPEDYQALLVGAGVLAGLGRKAEAEAGYRRGLQVAERHLQMYPDDARALYLGATACCQLGERERGLEWARRALAIDADEPMTLYNVACVYALLGQTEEAIGCLEKAVANGYRHKQWIEHDADLTSLRGHPRFQALLDAL